MKQEICVVSSFQAPIKVVGLHRNEQLRTPRRAKDHLYLARNINLEAKYGPYDKISNALKRLRKELLEMQEQDKGLYKQLTKLDENIRRLKKQLQVEQDIKAQLEEEFDSDSEAEVTSWIIQPNTYETSHDMINQSSPGSLNQDSGISVDDAADYGAMSAKPIDLKYKQSHYDKNVKGNCNKFKIQTKSHRRSASENGACTQPIQPIHDTIVQHPRSKSGDITDNTNIPSCIRKRKGSSPDPLRTHSSPNPSKQWDEGLMLMPFYSVKSIILLPETEQIKESIQDAALAKETCNKDKLRSHQTGETGLVNPVELTQINGHQRRAIGSSFKRNRGKDLALKRTKSMTHLDLTGAIFNGCSTNKKNVPRPQNLLPRCGSMGRIAMQNNLIHSSKVTKEIYDDRRRSSLRSRDGNEEKTSSGMDEPVHQTNFCRMSSTNYSFGSSSLSSVASLSVGIMGRTSSIVSLV